MSQPTPKSVISGVAYRIVSVGEQPCSDLSEFDGDDLQFEIDNNGPYTARGCGSIDGESVRFFEKDRHGVGRDIRVWRITRTPEGTFVAEHEVSL